MSAPSSRVRGATPAVVVIGISLMLAGATVTFLAFAPRPPEVTSTPSVSPTVELPPAPVLTDDLQARRIGELTAFAGWLRSAGARGFVGEVGWPDEPEWNELAAAWYATAARAGIASTAWAAGSWWPPGYDLAVYRSTEDRHVIDVAGGQATVLEDDLDPGVNLAGLEFGAETDFSAADPGLAGVDYYAEPADSYLYLAERGVETVRLPFRWERLQPTRVAALDPAYLALITGQLDAAANAGIVVILDLHNYGAYQTAEGADLLDGNDTDTLIDVWARLDDAVGEHPAVVGYGLMNEPHDLTSDVASGARLWERITQDTVIGLREAGVEKTLYVPGYDWSSLARWSSTHPSAWIDDPLDDFRYEAHHYWDKDGTGKYLADYSAELAGTATGIGVPAARRASRASMSSATRLPSRTA